MKGHRAFVAAALAINLILAPVVGNARKPVNKLQQLQKNRDFQKSAPEIKQSAQKVLSDPIFKPVPKNETGNLLLPIFDAISRFITWLNNLFGGRRGNPTFGSILVQGVIVVLIILLAALTILAIIRFRKLRIPKPVIDNGSELPDAAAPPDQWLEAARNLAKSGKFRDALRAVYIATLIQLDRARLIRYETHNTNWEHLRQLQSGGHTEAVQTLKPLTQSFDFIWYGERPAQKEDYDRFEEAYFKIQRLTPVRSESE